MPYFLQLLGRFCRCERPCPVVLVLVRKGGFQHRAIC